MAKIKVDTTALEKKLGTMSDKINAIKESIDDIDKGMQKVEKYWKGDASKLFLLNYAKTDTSLGSMMDILTESKNEMQEICKKYNNCERMSKKIKADMGKLEEIQTILENNAKKITHNITRIGELHKEIDVCWESQMWDSCYKTYCDLKKELEENAKEYEEYPKKLKACIEGYQETEEAIESLSQELPANVLK